MAIVSRPQCANTGIKMSSDQYKDSHYKDKWAAVRLSQLFIMGYFYTEHTSSLFRIEPWFSVHLFQEGCCLIWWKQNYWPCFMSVSPGYNIWRNVLILLKKSSKIWSILYTWLSLDCVICFYLAVQVFYLLFYIISKFLCHRYKDQSRSNRMGRSEKRSYKHSL